jgi:hypothetical protein
VNLKETISKLLNDTKSALGQPLALSEITIAGNCTIQDKFEVEKVEIKLRPLSDSKRYYDSMFCQMEKTKEIDFSKGPTILDLEPGETAEVIESRSEAKPKDDDSTDEGCVPV